MLMKNNKIFILILLLSFILMNIKFALTKENFFLSADTISKNEKDNTIKAEGNVSINNKQYKLKANEIIYFLKEKKVFAKGNVIIFEAILSVIAAVCFIPENFKICPITFCTLDTPAPFLEFKPP